MHEQNIYPCIIRWFFRFFLLPSSFRTICLITVLTPRLVWGNEKTEQILGKLELERVKWHELCSIPLIALPSTFENCSRTKPTRKYNTSVYTIKHTQNSQRGRGGANPHNPRTVLELDSIFPLYSVSVLFTNLMPISIERYIFDIFDAHIYCQRKSIQTNESSSFRTYFVRSSFPVQRSEHLYAQSYLLGPRLHRMRIYIYGRRYFQNSSRTGKMQKKNQFGLFFLARKVQWDGKKGIKIGYISFVSKPKKQEKELEKGTELFQNIIRTSSELVYLRRQSRKEEVRSLLCRVLFFEFLITVQDTGSRTRTTEISFSAGKCSRFYKVCLKHDHSSVMVT